MTDQHRAAPEQWALVEYWESTAPTAVESCLLELRDRIAALEANQVRDAAEMVAPPAPADSPIKVRRRPLQCPSPATIAECGGPCEASFMHCDCGLLEQLNPPLRPTPTHADSLVERVAFAIAGDADGPLNWKPEARAAIREVAAWLDTRGQHGCSLWLREEIELLDLEAKR